MSDTSLAVLAEYVRTVATNPTVGDLFVDCTSVDDKQKVNHYLLSKFPSAKEMKCVKPYFDVVVELGGPLEVRVTSLLLNKLCPCDNRGNVVKRTKYVSDAMDLPVAVPVENCAVSNGSE